MRHLGVFHLSSTFETAKFARPAGSCFLDLTPIRSSLIIFIFLCSVQLPHAIGFSWPHESFSTWDSGKRSILADVGLGLNELDNLNDFQQFLTSLDTDSVSREPLLRRASLTTGYNSITAGGAVATGDRMNGQNNDASSSGELAPVLPWSRSRGIIRKVENTNPGDGLVTASGKPFVNEGIAGLIGLGGGGIRGGIDTDQKAVINNDRHGLSNNSGSIGGRRRMSGGPRKQLRSRWPHSEVGNWMRYGRRR
ncbi:unnamed protein product [Protopolystoma xenopodis]|uniref:Uncharacterized protein n=1 Tax=Protopolystoma xenopodis TaxID=117903 RepID=A0A3S5CM93_9PLAT|nr:unnamed protein product [Protopolystoma xenopodis]